MLKEQHVAKTYKFPKSMGLCADKLYALRKKRIEEQNKVAELEAEENALKQHIIDNLPKSQQTGASGETANVKIVTKAVPVIEDLEKLYGYIRRTRRSDLLQKRLNESAVNEILDANKKIPGIGTFDKKSVSCTKI